MTKIKLPDGTTQYAVHGIFGDGAADLLDSGKKLTAKDIEYIKNNACEMLRMYNTPAECEAYMEGVRDVNNQDEFYTTFEQHEQIFGWNGATKITAIQVLSPDGFTIEREPSEYPTMKEANKAFNNWKKRYEQQGYYSSNGGRIPLNELKEHCQFLEVVPTED